MIILNCTPLSKIMKIMDKDEKENLHNRFNPPNASKFSIFTNPKQNNQ